MPSIKLPLVVIIGPTAVGKTEIAIELAEKLDGEIVSADSRLFYRGMDIGTAKPSQAECARARHHLIDVADPDETWSLVEFQRAARVAIEDIHQRQRVPFLVGGSGQYIRAVCEGWSAPPQAPDPQMRRALEAWANEIGAFELHARLSRLDPQAAEQIDWRNLRRTVRALEVILGTGKRFSEQRQKGKTPYRMLVVGLKRPRAELYARIDARIDAMMAAGLLEEVRGLLKLGYSASLPSLSAIGYYEMIAYLQGKVTLDEAVMLMKRNTRIFVRRQANWFKENDPDITWYEVKPGIVEELVKKIQGFKIA